MSFSIAQFEYDQVMMVTHILRNQSSNLYLPSPRLASFKMLLVLLLVLRLCGTRGNRRWEKAVSVLERVNMCGTYGTVGLSLSLDFP